MGRKKLSNAAKIRNYFARNPNATPAECIAALGVKPANVYLERSKMKKAKPIKFLKPELTNVSAEPTVVDVTPDWKAAIRDMVANMNTPPAADPINNPAHYTVGGIEVIDFIEAKQLNYRLGNAVKYIARSKHKGNYVEDLKKAVWYLEREIERSDVSDLV